MFSSDDPLCASRFAPRALVGAYTRLPFRPMDYHTLSFEHSERSVPFSFARRRRELLSMMDHFFEEKTEVRRTPRLSEIIMDARWDAENSAHYSWSTNVDLFVARLEETLELIGVHGWDQTRRIWDVSLANRRSPRHLRVDAEFIARAASEWRQFATQLQACRTTPDPLIPLARESPYDFWAAFWKYVDDTPWKGINVDDTEDQFEDARIAAVVYVCRNVRPHLFDLEPLPLAGRDAVRNERACRRALSDFLPRASKRFFRRPVLRVALLATGITILPREIPVSVWKSDDTYYRPKERGLVYTSVLS